MTLRVTIVAFEIPYPPVHGGRLDVWRRMKAMARMGVEIQLIGWSKELPRAEEEAALHQHARLVHRLPFRGGLMGTALRALALTRFPLEVTSRLCLGQSWQRLKRSVEAFRPHLVIADQLHSGAVALRLNAELGLPLIYRSHNIEHRYWARMRGSALGIDKLFRSLSLLHLKSYEMNMLRRCDAFFDISAEDLAFWHAAGFRHGAVLPPLIEFPEPVTGGGAGREYDVVFLGNLHSANNVEGLLWFLREVMPILQKAVPNVNVLLAGSRPVDALVEACSEASNVHLLADPDQAAPVYRSGRVLINPVATGSGVALKSLDMLAAARPIVSISKGVTGLPAQAMAAFRLADGAKAFADAIARALAESDPVLSDPARLHEIFGTAQVSAFLQRIEAVAARPAATSGQSAGVKG